MNLRIKQAVIILFMLAILAGVVFAPDRRYYIDAAYYNSTASTSQAQGSAILANCKYHQGSGSYATGSNTCNSFLQWNTTSTAWANITTTGAVTMDGSNPDQWSLPASAGNINYSQAMHTVTFNQAGTYNLRCYEPAETCSNSVALPSTVTTYTVNSSCTNCMNAPGVNCTIRCGDYCTINTNLNMGLKNITISGAGQINITANVTNFTLATVVGSGTGASMCNVTCLNGGCLKW